MGVDEGGLQVIDIKVITLLFSTYSPVALMVFAIHTISYICDSMMSKRYGRNGIGSGTFTPVLSTCPLHTNSGCGKERRILIGPW